MRKVIQRQLGKLHRSTESLFSRLESVPSEHMTRIPSSGGWSALQALNHIYLAEDLALSYVQYKISQDAVFPKLVPAAWFRTRIMHYALVSGRFKYVSPPAINMHTGQQVLELPELRQEWGVLRASLRELLERHEDELRSRMAFKHPFAGRMTLRQMLVFFSCHLEHHEKQIDAILYQLKDVHTETAKRAH